MSTSSGWPIANATARAKDSAEPAVLLRGLERFVTDDDGPGAGPLLRARADDLFR